MLSVQRPLRSLFMAASLVALIGACSGSDDNPPRVDGPSVTGDGGSSQFDGTGADDGAVGDGSGPVADGGGSCFDACTEGLSQCIGTQIQRCARGADGCTSWQTPEDCAGGKACNGGTCPQCTDDCTFGNTQCSSTLVQRCVVGSDGCNDWGDPVACPGGLDCASGDCPTCVDVCTENATQCAGGQVQRCERQSNGCLEWSAPQNCSGGALCTDGACPTCQNLCSPNTTQCAGDQIQSCEMQSSGCTDWGTPTACPSGKCSNNQCVTPCITGDKRCNGLAVEVCNSSQQWQLQQLCAQSCDAQTAQCEMDVTCTVGTRRCNNNLTQTCNATGTAWLTVATCAFGCLDGLCTGACTPGDRRCNADKPEECDSTGASWTQEAACSTFCYRGHCADAELVVDADANRELDGELVYAGDVVIKNSSVVTVPSGRLVIRAKRFILDASSSISVAAQGVDPRGAGTAGGATSCSAGACTASGTVGGGGGGHATNGVNGSRQLSCYSYYTRYCTVTRGGGSAYAISDDEAVWGAQGGACSGTAGGLGGGLIAIYAEEIVIAGAISANGEAGAGCAGGGSGGGIVLRATHTLDVSGALSAIGGQGGSSSAGAGGEGAIKLLYGNTHALTGSTTGTVFSSYMPPDDLSSSTHPDPELWYNDGFAAMELAWSNPFSESGGYYYVLNRTLDFVPAPANALYQTAEVLQYAPEEFSAGANYVHVSVVGPSFDPSEVQSHFRVQVNATPPSIASQSHASQTSWYDNYSAFLTWSLPQVDENTKRFYWILDRYKETTPNKSANTIPMNLADVDSSKRLLLPISAPGIWFFHLIAEDTAGYLTKSGATFRMQVGTDPGKGGVSGAITDSSTGSFVSGVSVTLNRGVHTTTTDAQGAYAFTNNTVFAQEYEVRATKEGYDPAVQTVTVEAGATSTVNLTLTPQ